jgi:hypothetical protein
MTGDLVTYCQHCKTKTWHVDGVCEWSDGHPKKAEPMVEDPTDLKRHDPEWQAGYEAGMRNEPQPTDASPIWLDGYERAQRDGDG